MSSGGSLGWRVQFERYFVMALQYWQAGQVHQPLQLQ